MRTLALLLIAIPLVSQELTLGGGVNLYSREEELKLGRAAAAEFRAKARILDAREAIRYLDAVAGQLTSQFAASYKFTFAIFDDRHSFVASDHAFPDKEAQRTKGEMIAMADGSIFVPLTLLKRAQSEAEVVRAVAHAMAHVADRHVTRALTRADLIRRAMDGMPPEMRRQHRTVPSQFKTQQVDGFERQAAEWAKRWTSAVIAPAVPFDQMRSAVARL